MTEAEAKRFTKEIAPDKTKTLNKDLRIENDLNRDLLQMLDQRLLGRSECEIYVRFTPEQQQKIAEQYKRVVDSRLPWRGKEPIRRNRTWKKNAMTSIMPS